MEVTCQCGLITLTTPTPSPISVYHCHCTECQRQSGSAFGTSAIFPAAGIFPLAPHLASNLEVWTRPANEGRTMDCYFCKRCGTRVLHRIREPDGKERDTVSIKGGCVKGLVWKGAMHIYTGTAVVDIPEGAVKWEGAPGEMAGRPEVKK